MNGQKQKMSKIAKMIIMLAPAKKRRYNAGHEKA
jgi:hypothetical protein